jgi:hypothetical protein
MFSPFWLFWFYVFRSINLCSNAKMNDLTGEHSRRRAEAALWRAAKAEGNSDSFSFSVLSVCSCCIRIFIFACFVFALSVANSLERFHASCSRDF